MKKPYKQYAEEFIKRENLNHGHKNPDECSLCVLQYFLQFLDERKVVNPLEGGCKPLDSRHEEGELCNCGKIRYKLGYHKCVKPEEDIKTDDFYKFPLGTKPKEINPLKKSVQKRLNSMQLKDLSDKIQELIDDRNETNFNKK